MLNRKFGTVLFLAALTMLSGAQSEAAFGRKTLKDFNKHVKVDILYNTVDVDKIMGTWYSLGTTPAPYQTECYSAVAQYSKREDGTIKVINTCKYVEQKEKGKIHKKERSIEGSLRKGKKTFQVSFFKPFWSDYNIILLEKDYKYMVVANKDKDQMWILSRSESVPNETVCGILEDLRVKGLVTAQFMLPKNVCYLK